MSASVVMVKFDSEPQMQAWVKQNAFGFSRLNTLYLHGDLGAGKTSFSRALIQALGHQGRVKSPTYTLLETYELQALTVCHFDLYRLSDPEELAYLGADDYLGDDYLWLVEWPERGQGFLVAPDVTVHIGLASVGRVFEFAAHSTKGQALLKELQD